MVKCSSGRLSSPVYERGRKRVCKLKKKSKAGRKRDRASRSSEAHEIRYRRDKRRGKR